MYLAEAVNAMNKLVKEGKIRLVGLSAYSEKDFERLVPVIKPQVLQSWANAMDDHFVREGSRVDRLMEKYGLSFVAFSPLAQGLLLDKFDPKKPPVFESGDHRQNSEKFSEKALAVLAPKLGKLKARFGSSTEDLASMALNYLLSYPKVCCAIPGFRNERQARCNVAGMGRSLTREDVQFIRETLA
jgi:aryl-alcohol dehydrogenase-like predicted oxidoreductase